jgi:hypothetical protein
MLASPNAAAPQIGIGLIEEAAIDRIPVIAVDPKGNFGNML